MNRPNIDLGYALFTMLRPELQEEYEKIFITNPSNRNEYPIEEIDMLTVTVTGAILIIRNGNIQTFSNSNLYLKKRVDRSIAKDE